MFHLCFSIGNTPTLDTSSHKGLAISLSPKALTSKTECQGLLKHQYVKLWCLIFKIKGLASGRASLSKAERLCHRSQGIYGLKFSLICMQYAASSSCCPGSTPASTRSTQKKKAAKPSTSPCPSPHCQPHLGLGLHHPEGQLLSSHQAPPRFP